MKTRMRFVKCGSMKFIGHLDCAFSEAIRCKNWMLRTQGVQSAPVNKFCFAAWRRCDKVTENILMWRFYSLPGFHAGSL